LLEMIVNRREGRFRGLMLQDRLESLLDECISLFAATKASVGLSSLNRIFDFWTAPNGALRLVRFHRARMRVSNHGRIEGSEFPRGHRRAGASDVEFCSPASLRDISFFDLHNINGPDIDVDILKKNSVEKYSIVVQDSCGKSFSLLPNAVEHPLLRNDLPARLRSFPDWRKRRQLHRDASTAAPLSRCPGCTSQRSSAVPCYCCLFQEGCPSPFGRVELEGLWCET
jgi:hypothetical protein